MIEYFLLAIQCETESNVKLINRNLWYINLIGEKNKFYLFTKVTVNFLALNFISEEKRFY